MGGTSECTGRSKQRRHAPHRSISRLNSASSIARFRREYNDERPHEALNQTPPARHYTPSPRLFPEHELPPPHDGDDVEELTVTALWHAAIPGIAAVACRRHVGIEHDARS
jgi:hypothetical protein